MERDVFIWSVSEYHPRKQILCCITSKVDFQKPRRNRRDGKYIYLVLFVYPNDVRFSMLIITHPQTIERKKKDRASPKWIVLACNVILASGTRIISPHRQQPRYVSFSHRSVKKGDVFTLNSSYAVFVLLSSEGGGPGYISIVHNKSLRDRTNTFFGQIQRWNEMLHIADVVANHDSTK